MAHTLSHRAGQPKRALAVTGGDLWIEEGDVTLVLIFPLRQGLFHRLTIHILRNTAYLSARQLTADHLEYDLLLGGQFVQAVQQAGYFHGLNASLHDFLNSALVCSRQYFSYEIKRRHQERWFRKCVSYDGDLQAGLASLEGHSSQVLWYRRWRMENNKRIDDIMKQKESLDTMIFYLVLEAQQYAREARCLVLAHMRGERLVANHPWSDPFSQLVQENGGLPS